MAITRPISTDICYTSPDSDYKRWNLVEHDSIAGAKTYYYSVNGGTNWTLISTDGETRNADATSFEFWLPDSILGAEDSIDEFKIRVSESGNTDSDDTTARKITIVNVVPNSTLYPPTTEIAKIYENHPLNILWDANHVVTDVDKVNIYVTATIGGSTTTTLIAQEVDNDGSWVWSNNLSIAEDEIASNVKFKVIGLFLRDGDYEETPNYSQSDELTTGVNIYGEGDDLTDMDEDYVGADYTDYARVLKLHKRIEIEKGIAIGEGVTIDQIEAQYPIVIEQRNEDGQLEVTDPVKPHLAYNLVVGVGKDIPDLQRAKVGYLNFNTTGTVVSTEDPMYFGYVKYIDIPLTWSLNPRNKLLIECDQVTSTGDHEKPKDDIVLLFDYPNATTIRAYCVIFTDASLSSLECSYIFYYRIQEIVT